MSPRGVIRLFLSSSALLGAAACLWMVGQSWDQEANRLVDELNRVAAADPYPFLVVVDAGHGGNDGGTQGFGQLEKDISLDLATRLEQRLKNAGCQVLMTRKDDTYPTLEERCEVANKAKATVFVSLHLNADPKSNETHGVETYYSSRKKLGNMTPIRELLGLKHDIPVRDVRSEWLAGIVHSRVCRTTGATDRTVRDSHFVVVMQTECPAILVECGYLTNQTESLCFTDNGYKDGVVEAVASGVLHYLRSIQMNPRRGLRFEPPPVLVDERDPDMEPEPKPEPENAPTPDPAAPPAPPPEGAPSPGASPPVASGGSPEPKPSAP
ncbi:N-acetylmuramoyl-L-alanine amidase [Verrucomicrobium sp. BvORR106]|uniref:N-acetylmuramoyl-L-alanine amidase family protein n=1 Tax=Verrucomicrobium sp. BvORR106 TaxID=1403819 RepID=UPI00056FBB8B|nr:N-acetylmuramoyl-L-alanine amidase [Verrucomicrobium sp. BvORR106]